MTTRPWPAFAAKRTSSAKCGIAGAVIGLVTSLTPAAAADKDVSSFTLKNGMRAVVIEDHRLPIVAHSVWYKVGGADDGPGLSGRAHFLEHMMFKATKKYPKRYLDKAVASAGGINNATTSYDYTNYYEVIPKEKLEEMMALEADRMTNIQFTSEELDVERGAILQERNMRIDSAPMNRLKERMRAEMFRGTPYETMPAGRVADINATTTKDALELYRRTYGPNNATLVVAGDVTLEEIRALAEKHYGAIAPMANPPSRPDQIELRPVTQSRLVERDAQITHPSFGRYYRIPAEDHEDFAPLYVLMNHLNIYTGRLNTELVQRLHVASSAGSEVEATRLAGLLAIGATAAPGVDLAKVEAALDAIVDDIRKNGIPEDEVKRLANAIAVQIVFDQDDIVERMNIYGSHLTAGRSLEWIGSIIDRYKAITAADVKRVAARYLVNENTVTGELLPLAQPVAESK